VIAPYPTNDHANNANQFSARAQSCQADTDRLH